MSDDAKIFTEGSFVFQTGQFYQKEPRCKWGSSIFPLGKVICLDQFFDGSHRFVDLQAGLLTALHIFDL